MEEDIKLHFMAEENRMLGRLIDEGNSGSNLIDYCHDFMQKKMEEYIKTRGGIDNIEKQKKG